MKALEKQKVAVSGASGFVGRALTDFLVSSRCTVLRMVRRQPESDREVFWNPETGEIDTEALEGIDAFIHLGGESISGGRWTPSKKARILASREKGTDLVARTLAGLKQKPAVLVSASAVGYYGNRGSEILSEDSPPGSGFLPEVCRKWEAACRPAEETGIRTVKLRIGMVLSAKGGALPRLLPVFRAGLGGVIGSGRQYTSWITLDDLVRVIRHVIEDDGITGPVNAVSPHPVTNAGFTKILAKVLKRPAVFRVPAFVLHAAFGEMGQALLLDGCRAIPQALSDRFEFQHQDLESALESILINNK